MKRGLACCLVIGMGAVLNAGAAAHTNRAAASPLLGVWKGDIVRIHNRAIIGRNVLTLRIGSARVGSTFKGEIPSPPGCTVGFQIAARVRPTTWLVGIPRAPSGDPDDCSVISGFSDAYTRDAFKLVLLDNRRLRVTGLSRGVRVQATLVRR